MKTLTIVFLGVSTLLSGCASMSDSSTTRAQGAGFGAAIGAGLGAIVGAATGDTEKGALIGAAVGGVAASFIVYFAFFVLSACHDNDDLGNETKEFRNAKRERRESRRSRFC